MPLNTNLAHEAITLTKWLISIPSVAHVKGPALISQAIYDGLSEFPYFKNHPEHLTLQAHEDSAKSSVVALVKGLEDVQDTLVLLCHTDTNSPYHYGMLKGLSTNADELRKRLLEMCGSPLLDNKNTSSLLSADSDPEHPKSTQGSSMSDALSASGASTAGAVSGAGSASSSSAQDEEEQSTTLSVGSNSVLSGKLKRALARDEAMLGLGVLESKCATGSMLVALKELSDNSVRLNLNILFICTSEAAINHKGIKSCMKFLQQLVKKENLKLRLCLNAQPNLEQVPHDQQLHLYTGNYGKVEPSFYIIGNSSTSYRPYEGFSASIIAAELIRALELNPKLTQKLQHSPLVPTFDSLRVKEFGKDFSPDGMQVSFNLPIGNLDLEDLLETLKEVAATAIENAADLVEMREATFAQMRHKEYTPTAKDAEVVSFSDLLERASHNFKGNLHKALQGMVQKCRSEGLSLHQASITIIERLNELARLPRPSIVVYYTDNFVPTQGLNANLSQDRELFMILDGLLHRFAKTSPIVPTIEAFYAPTDANFLRPEHVKRSLKTLEQECPLGINGEHFSGLNVPTITLGVGGGDLSLLTEHVFSSMCQYLPAFIISLSDALAKNPEESLEKSKTDDLQQHLEELSRRANSIANATVKELQTIEKQKQNEGFYSEVTQGTLNPHSLESFLRERPAAAATPTPAVQLAPVSAPEVAAAAAAGDADTESASATATDDTNNTQLEVQMIAPDKSSEQSTSSTQEQELKQEDTPESALEGTVSADSVSTSGDYESVAAPDEAVEKDTEVDFASMSAADRAIAQAAATAAAATERAEASAKGKGQKNHEHHKSKESKRAGHKQEDKGIVIPSPLQGDSPAAAALAAATKAQMQAEARALAAAARKAQQTSKVPQLSTPEVERDRMIIAPLLGGDGRGEPILEPTQVKVMTVDEPKGASLTHKAFSAFNKLFKGKNSSKDTTAPAGASAPHADTAAATTTTTTTADAAAAPAPVESAPEISKAEARAQEASTPESTAATIGTDTVKTESSNRAQSASASGSTPDTESSISAPVVAESSTAIVSSDIAEIESKSTEHQEDSAPESASRVQNEESSAIATAVSASLEDTDKATSQDKESATQESAARSAPAPEAQDNNNKSAALSGAAGAASADTADASAELNATATQSPEGDAKANDAASKSTSAPTHSIPEKEKKDSGLLSSHSLGVKLPLNKIGSFFNKLDLKSALNKLQEHAKSPNHHHTHHKKEPVFMAGSDERNIDVSWPYDDQEPTLSSPTNSSLAEPKEQIPAMPSTQSSADADTAGAAATKSAGTAAASAGDTDSTEVLAQELDALVTEHLEQDDNALTDNLINTLHHEDTSTELTLEQAQIPSRPKINLDELLVVPEPQSDRSKEQEKESTTPAAAKEESAVAAKTETKAELESNSESESNTTEDTDLSLNISGTLSEKVTALMAPAITAKIEQQQLASIDMPKQYPDSGLPLSDGVYANSINVEVSTSLSGSSESAPQEQSEDASATTAIAAATEKAFTVSDSSSTSAAPETAATTEATAASAESTTASGSEEMADKSAATTGAADSSTESSARLKKSESKSSLDKAIASIESLINAQQESAGSAKNQEQDSTLSSLQQLATQDITSSADAIAQEQAMLQLAIQDLPVSERHDSASASANTGMISSAKGASSAESALSGAQSIPDASTSAAAAAATSSDSEDNNNDLSLKRYDPAQTFAELLYDDEEEALNAKKEAQAREAAEAEAAKLKQAAEAADHVNSAITDLMNTLIGSDESEPDAAAEASASASASAQNPANKALAPDSSSNSAQIAAKSSTATAPAGKSGATDSAAGSASEDTAESDTAGLNTYTAHIRSRLSSHRSHDALGTKNTLNDTVASGRASSSSKQSLSERRAALYRAMHDEESALAESGSTQPSSRLKANESQGTSSSAYRSMYTEEGSRRASRASTPASTPASASTARSLRGSASTAATAPDASTATRAVGSRTRGMGSYIDLTEQGQAVSYDPEALSQSLQGKSRAKARVGASAGAVAGANASASARSVSSHLSARSSTSTGAEGALPATRAAKASNISLGSSTGALGATRGSNNTLGSIASSGINSSARAHALGSANPRNYANTNATTASILRNSSLPLGSSSNNRTATAAAAAAANPAARASATSGEVSRRTASARTLRESGAIGTGARALSSTTTATTSPAASAAVSPARASRARSSTSQLPGALSGFEGTSVRGRKSTRTSASAGTGTIAGSTTSNHSHTSTKASAASGSTISRVPPLVETIAKAPILHPPVSNPNKTRIEKKDTKVQPVQAIQVHNPENDVMEPVAASNPGVRIVRSKNATPQAIVTTPSTSPQDRVVYAQGGSVMISKRISADEARELLNQKVEPQSEPTASIAIVDHRVRRAEDSTNSTKDEEKLPTTIVVRGK